MHPAKSVIIFTVLSGAGFGLIALLSFIVGIGHTRLASGQWTMEMMALACLAIILSSIGLISATFHLGNPQRAWRALSQWRSSWLSREGVLAMITLSLFSLWLIAAFLNITMLLWFGAWLGIIIGGLAIVTIFATAMIYTQLRPVPRWHTPLTPLCYLGFGLSGGILIIAAAHPQNLNVSITAFISLIVAWGIKIMWWRRSDKTGRGATGSSRATATGLSGYSDIKLFEAPHFSKNYLMREMVFEVGRKHARRLRRFSVILGFIFPAFLIIVSFFISSSFFLLFIGLLSNFIGVFIERWLFFAEAEHLVALYYGK